MCKRNNTKLFYKHLNYGNIFNVNFKLMFNCVFTGRFAYASLVRLTMPVFQKFTGFCLRKVAVLPSSCLSEHELCKKAPLLVERCEECSTSILAYGVVCPRKGLTLGCTGLDAERRKETTWPVWYTISEMGPLITFHSGKRTTSSPD